MEFRMAKAAAKGVISGKCQKLFFFIAKFFSNQTQQNTLRLFKFRKKAAVHSVYLIIHARQIC
jgi:hypothetical protein